MAKRKTPAKKKSGYDFLQDFGVIRDKQGWNDESLWALAREFIFNDPAKAEAFVKHVERQARQENQFNADHEDLRRHDALGLNDGKPAKNCGAYDDDDGCH